MAITRAAKRVGAALLSTEIIKQIATIRGEFQQLEVAFTTLLQSKSKANALMSEMVTLAAKTPFDLKGVAHGARQLLAYGFAADDITGTLTRLGNVAAGLRLPLERLTYLYGTTMTQGRLYARDMMQFTTSGIPMLQEMAKMYGKSTDEINAMVSAGKIGFEDVKKVIENMTNSGGKFYNLMEEQSKTITGQISNLGDAIDVMFNDMGKSQEGAISGAISGATYLVENYEKVLDVVGQLAVAYGTYKAALIVLAAIERLRYQASLAHMAGLTTMQGLTEILTAKTKALNKALLSNPYVLAAAAAAALAVVIYNLVTAKSAEEQATERVNKAIDEYNQKQDELKSKAEESIRITNDEVNTAYSKQRAYESLISLYPELLKRYTEEQIKMMMLTDAGKELLKILNDIKDIRIESNAYDGLRQAIADYNKYNEEIASGEAAARPRDREKRDEALESIKKWKEEVDKIRKTSASAAPAEVKIATLQGNITELETQNEKIDDLIAAAIEKQKNNPGLFIPFDESEAFYQGQKQSNLQTIKSKQGEIKTLQGGDKKTDKNKAYWEKQKENAMSALAEMETSLKGTAKWNEIVAQIAKYDAEIKKYSTGGKGKSNDSDQLKNTLAAEKERIDALADGRVKDLAQIQLNKEAKLAAIDQEERELKKKYKGGEIPKDQQDLYTARRKTASDVAAIQTSEIERKYADEVTALYAQIGDVFLSEEERKRNGIKETYDQYRKQLKQKLDGGTITQAEYNVKLPEIDAAQKQAEIKPLLDQYQTYADQRKQIEDKFNGDIAALRTKAGEAATAEERNRLNAAADLAEQKRGEIIASLDIKTLKDNINWDSVFGDLSKSSTASISHTLEQVQQLFNLNKGNMSAEDIRDMTQAIEQMQNELAQRNPFGGLAQSFKAIGTAKDEVIAALTEYKESYSALTEAQNEYNVALSEQQALDLAIDAGILTEDSEAYAQAKDKVANAADKQSKAEKQCVDAETKAYVANNNLSRSYATFTSRLGAVHGVIGRVGANAKNLADVFDSDVADKIGKSLGFIDEVVGATKGVLDEIGKASSTVTSAISGTVDAASQGMIATGGIAVTTMSTMEKASVILAVISAALQIATAIAGLFNNDKAHQEEIDALQERIKQLQWELDNIEVGRLKNNNVDILKDMRDIYVQTTAEVMKLHATEIARGGAIARMLAPGIYQTDILAASTDKLADLYLKVGYTADKALGGAKYKEAQDALKNMAQQQLLLQRSIEEESSKSKDVDTDQIADWERQIQELGAESIEMINAMVEDIIGGSSSDIAKDLGDAFIEAFQEGENAAEAWGDKVNDIVSDIMKRMLIQQFLEKPLGRVFDEYKDKWFGSGEFSLDNVINSMGDFANDLMTEGDKFKTIWDNLPDNIKDMFKPSEEDREASQKGFAAMSQDSADKLDGGFTAIQAHTYSINEKLKLLQPDVSIIRSMMGEMMGNAARQLMVMQGIETNTRSLVRLERIESDMGSMKSTLNDIYLKGLKLR